MWRPSFSAAMRFFDAALLRRNLSRFWPLIAARENVLNAGVDLNGFQPVPFDELLENNIRFKEDHPA